MKHVWIVATVDYSDFIIHGIFSTRKLARAYKKDRINKYSRARVEIIKKLLNPENKKVTWYYYASITRYIEANNKLSKPKIKTYADWTDNKLEYIGQGYTKSHKYIYIFEKACQDGTIGAISGKSGSRISMADALSKTQKALKRRKENLTLLDDLDSLEQDTKRTREEYVRAPFKYPGSKSKSIEKILVHLPYRTKYCEPFGGSGSVLLARNKSKLEVFNDRYAGVVAFYRCLRDEEKMKRLCNRLELTVHSREEFIWSKETWEHDASDDVERAARWFYMVEYSFNSLGRNFGRSTSCKASLVPIRDRIKLFPMIHERLKNVQIENQDWEQCMLDYDSPDTVFYADPPYLATDSGIYKDKFNIEDHRRLLYTISQMKGFVALSGYTNELYNSQDFWDEIHTWEVHISIKAKSYTDNNQKKQFENIDESLHKNEVLWIKE